MNLPEQFLTIFTAGWAGLPLFWDLKMCLLRLSLQKRSSGLPQEMREAAAVDGTRPWRLFWKLELPLMMPTVFVAVFVRFIDGFRVFDNIYTLVGAGPGGSTTSMSIYIYETFLRRGEIGKSMAAAILLFASAFIVLSVAQFLLRRASR